MTVSTTARLGMTRWSADGDPQNRAQFDGNVAQLEGLVAIDLQSTLALRPAAAAGNKGAYHWATDVHVSKALTRSDGTTWRAVGAGNSRPLATALGLDPLAYTLLGQGNPAAVNTIIYTVPAANVARIARLHVGNYGASGSSSYIFRVAVRAAGGNGLTLGGPSILAYDIALMQGEFLDLLEGLVLPPGATISVWSQHANVGFQVWGEEYVATDLDETPKLLQANPGAVDTVLYTVPAGKRFVAAGLIVANVGAAAAVEVYRASVVPAGGYAANAFQTIAYDTSLGRQDYHEHLRGLTLPAGASVGVRGSSGNVTFSLSGVEVV